MSLLEIFGKIQKTNAHNEARLSVKAQIAELSAQRDAIIAGAYGDLTKTDKLKLEKIAAQLQKLGMQ